MTNAPEPHIFTLYPPPHTLTVDFLGAVAFCSSAPLHALYPGHRFVSLFGKTPLLLWFAEIKTFRFAQGKDEAGVLGDGKTPLYHELSVAAVKRNGTLLGVHLGVDSEFSLQIGLGYGMPKIRDTIRSAAKVREKQMTVGEGEQTSSACALPFGSGQRLGSLFSLLLPRRVCRVQFPSGSQVTPVLETAPCLAPAWVTGQLRLSPDRLPQPVPLFRLGVFFHDFQMTLPGLEAADR